MNEAVVTASALKTRCSVVNKDAQFYLVFFLLIPHPHQNLHMLVLHSKKCNQTETLTQYSAWSQFIVDYFSQQPDLLYFGFLSHQTCLTTAANILQEQAIYCSMAAS